MDYEQRVIYMGGFSMTLFPSLRLAYMVLPRSLVKVANNMAQFELSVATVQQPALAEFITEGHFMSHIRKMRKTYQQRERFLRQFLQKHLGDTTTISGTEGGLNFILHLPSHINDARLSDNLARAGIVAHPLNDYYLHQNDKLKTRLNGLVIGFACANRTDLEKSAVTLIEQIKCS
jgi:GntR family transcriptional regulator/MocR family aminotransferase